MPITFHSMTTMKTFAHFNTSTFQGRIFDATITEGKYGEFVSVTVITNLSDDSDGVTVTFNNSNGLLTLAKKGYLTKGRMVHVTGHISGVSEVYEKDGQVQLRKRPQISLDSTTAQVTLGAIPKQDASAQGTVVVKRKVEATKDVTPMVADEEIAF